MIEARPEHQVVYQDLCDLLKKHAAKVSALEMLAIAANMVGKLAALQDQRTVTPKEAMETVAKNIEFGNAEAVAELMKASGTQQ